VASVPTGLIAVGQTSGNIDLDWTNHGPYTALEVYRNNVFYKTLGVSVISYTDSSVSSNTTYTYKIYAEWEGGSGYSSTDSCALWTASPATDDVNISDSKTVTVDFAYSKTEEMAFVEATEVEHETTPTEPQAYEIDETDTCTMSDTYEASHIGSQDWKYYLGNSIGEVCPYAETYEGDGVADINAYYQTKALDFADQYPQFRDTWKTVRYVYLDYIDLQECSVTLSLSTDNGTTWASSSKTLGDGDLTVKRARFDFNTSGRFFVIKLAHSSNDRLFQWVRMNVEFLTESEWFSVN
jgi:hypothetical protein